MNHCFECGKTAEYDHHVVPRSLGGVKTLPLCGVCHGLVHGIKKVNVKNLTKTALAQKRINGEYTGGYVPYGFAMDGNGKLCVDSVEVKVIDRIVKLRGGGASYTAIASELNAAGYRTKTGKNWFPQTVKNIVKRAA